MPSSSISSSDPSARLLPPESGTTDLVKVRCVKCGLLRLASFFILLGVMTFATHWMVNLGLARIPSSEFGVSNQILSGRVNAEIVISGSSRAVSHYDSRIIQQVTGLKTFNIGRNGSQTDMQLSVLKAYLKHNAKPRLLIHNLDSFSFVCTHEVYNPGQYLPYLREEDIYQALLRITPRAWKWRYVPLYGYVVDDMQFTWLRGLAGMLGLYPSEDHFQGYHPGHLRWTGDFERFKAQHPKGVAFEIEPQGVRDMEELVEVCRLQGIPVLLVYSPVYYEMQAIEQNRSEVFSRFQQLSERWHAAIWDYSTSPICKRRDLFYNSQHLNQEGAAAFSTDLASRLAAERPSGE